MSWVRDSGIDDLILYMDRPEVREGGWARLAGKPAELKVVIGEIERCRKDFAYAARNYFWITNKHRQDIPLRLWESQELLYEKVQELKAKHKPQKLLVLKARQLGFCLDPNTKVLTSDLRWLTLDDIQPGQEIVATDESSTGRGRGNSRKMRTASLVA
jgi:hypothetical protein